ncbi:peptidoglycan-binding domain-containing protein [Chachezhania antarctica]|uniref:peptidoglycan-binding domain-containing protein n=1 Tax=Chachezhania antarctica TaxID=2340860 RepID=UPI001F09B863|nr:peptidoglycan-binding domain-containing protein [Chachezhania antarctica]
MRAKSGVMALAGMLAACQPFIPPYDDTNDPARAPKATCITTYTRPAVIRTETVQTLLRPARPAADGTAAQEARYKTTSRQVIVQKRETRPVDTPCPDTMTPDYIASLQRALKIRGLYTGAATGTLDADTRAAIRAYQRPRGMDWDVLTLQTAQSLGLSAVPRDGSGRTPNN